jgi:hypothetical protein
MKRLLTMLSLMIAGCGGTTQPVQTEQPKVKVEQPVQQAHNYYEAWKIVRGDKWLFAVPPDMIDVHQLNDQVDAMFKTKDGFMFISFFVNPNTDKLEDYAANFGKQIADTGARPVAAKLGTINGKEAVLLVFTYGDEVSYYALFTDGKRAFNFNCTTKMLMFRD